MTRINTTSKKILQPCAESPHSVSRSTISGSPFVARLLLFFIFITIVRQTLLVRQRVTTYDLSAVDTFAGLDIAAVFLAACLLAISGRLWRTWPSLQRSPAVWLCGYYLVCAASSIWSSAPIYSLFRAIEYLVLFFSTLTVFSYYVDFAKAESAFLHIAIATIILQMCMVIRLQGLFHTLEAWHTNAYSASSAILFCYCLGEYLGMTKAQRDGAKRRSRRLQRIGVFALCTLALGTSAASNIAAAVGCLLILLVLRRPVLLLKGIWVGLLLFLLGIGWESLQNLLMPGKSEHAIKTASGRILLWKMLWNKFLESPAFGYGFGLISGGRYRIFAQHAHSSLFTVLIGTGLLGLTIFAVFTWRIWWAAIVEAWRRTPGSLGFIGALAALFLNSLAAPLLADRWVPASIVFASLIALFIFYVRTQGANR